MPAVTPYGALRYVPSKLGAGPHGSAPLLGRVRMSGYLFHAVVAFAVCCCIGGWFGAWMEARWLRNVNKIAQAQLEAAYRQVDCVNARAEKANRRWSVAMNALQRRVR